MANVYPEGRNSCIGAMAGYIDIGSNPPNIPPVMKLNIPYVPDLPFLGLSPEIHTTIGLLLGPQDLVHVSKACRKCKEAYDTDSNWRRFLEAKYQVEVPARISKEMFTFEVRKRYGIKYQLSEASLNNNKVIDLLSRRCLDKEEMPFFQEFELMKLCDDAPMIDRLIKGQIISIEDAKSLAVFQIQRQQFGIHLSRLLGLVSCKKMSVEDIKNLTNDECERFKQDDIGWAIQTGCLSFQRFKSLTAKQCSRLFPNENAESEMYTLVYHNILSLEDIEHLSDNEAGRLKNRTIIGLLWSKKLSLQELKCLTDKQYEGLCRSNYIIDSFRKQRMSLRDLEKLTEKQIDRLINDHISELVDDKIALSDLDRLTDKQVDRLETRSIFKLFQKGILSLQSIENLTNKQYNRLSPAMPVLSNICALLMEKILSLREIENLTDKQVERLSCQDVFVAFKAKKLTLKEIKSLSTKELQKKINRRMGK